MKLCLLIYTIMIKIPVIAPLFRWNVSPKLDLHTFASAVTIHDDQIGEMYYTTQLNSLELEGMI